MIRSALVYGGIAGTATILTMLLGFEFGGEGAGSQAVGFLIMFIALSLIFFGIKRYRDVEQGGVITFAKAFGLGAIDGRCCGRCVYHHLGDLSRRNRLCFYDRILR